MHTPLRLHGAIATCLQAIFTGSGMDFGPRARCPTMLFELRDTNTRLGCCVDTSQASVTYRSEFTLRDCSDGRGSTVASPLMLLGRGCVDMDAFMVDDRKSI